MWILFSSTSYSVFQHFQMLFFFLFVLYILLTNLEKKYYASGCLAFLLPWFRLCVDTRLLLQVLTVLDEALIVLLMAISGVICSAITMLEDNV